MQDLKNIILKFSNSKIGLIGDLMIDEWIIGPVERISPEAPIPIVKWENYRTTAGGAANTAANIASLGGQVSIFGLIGKDSAGTHLLNILKQKKINISSIIRTKQRPTTRKIRIIGNRGPEQQIVRIDKEDVSEIGENIVEKFLDLFEQKISDLDLIIFSDYDKGLITKNMAQQVIEICNSLNKCVIVDTKPKRIDYFYGASLFTPNAEQAGEMSGIQVNNNLNQSVEEAGKILQKKLRSNIVITRGDKGMSIFTQDKFCHVPTKPREIYDVAGAGDTAVAALGLAMACGANLKIAAQIANLAAGIAVSKHGTTAVKQKELLEIL